MCRDAAVARRTAYCTRRERDASEHAAARKLPKATNTRGSGFGPPPYVR